MSLRSKTRFLAECFAVTIALAIIPLLPRSLLLALSRGAGRLTFRFAGRLRKVALANLDIAYGTDVSLDRKEDILRGAFTSFALLLLDMFWFGRFTAARIRRYVRYDPSFDVYFVTSPLLAVTGHIGNWEVLGQALSLRGAPLSSVATPIGNRYVDWVLNRQRRITGQEVIKRSGAVRSIMKKLASDGRVALLMDQNTLPEDGGVFVDFFGLPVPVSKAVEVLALRQKVPVFFGYAIADDKGVYHVHGLPLLKPGEDEFSEGRITRYIAEQTELVVKKHPEKWLWMYKRWKFIPGGVSRERYPYYARYAERTDL